MALDLKTWRSQYPEFKDAPNTVVVQILAQAALRTPANIWGDLEDEGHGLLTAHMMAMRPEGRDMRLEVDGMPSSIYWPERRRLGRLVASGLGSLQRVARWCNQITCASSMEH